MMSGMPPRGGRGRAPAYLLLGLVTALVAGLVIWRVADPPSTTGDALADPAGVSTADTRTQATGSDDSGTVSTETDGTETDSTETDGTETSGTERSGTEGTDTAGTDRTDGTSTSPDRTTGTRNGRTIRVGVRSLPTGTDPATDTDFADLLWRQVFDTVTTYRGSKPVAAADLATSWQPAKDSTEWTFKLAAGRTFQDGTPVDGTAICANFDFWNTRKGDSEQGKYFNWQFYFGGFAGQASAIYRQCRPTANSVVLTFARPMPALPDILTQTSFSVHAPSSLSGKKPVGSGPFSWASASATTVSLRAVAGGPARSGGLDFIGLDDPAVMERALQNGDLDLAYLSSQLPATSGSQIDPETPATMISLNLYGSKGPLADAGTRRAVVAAVDRTALAEAGGGKPAGSVLPDVFAAPRATFPSYDPAAAKAGLQGKKLTLTLGVRGNSRAEPKMAAVVEAELQKVGVVVKKKAYPNVSDYYDAVQAHEFDLGFGQTFAYTADVGDLLGVYQSAGVYGSVLPAASTKAFDAEIRTALTQGSYAARQNSSTAVLTDLLEQHALVPVVALGGGWLVGAHIDGLQQAPFGAVTLASVTHR